MYSDLHGAKGLAEEKNKLSAVPFQDFLVFLFKSATDSPTSQLSSSSQLKDFAGRKLEGKEPAVILSLFRKGNEVQMNDALRKDFITRRHSCPDIFDTENSGMCSSLGSSLGIYDEDNENDDDDDNNNNDDSQIQEDNEEDIVSQCPTPAALFSTETSLEDDIIVPDLENPPELSKTESDLVHAPLPESNNNNNSNDNRSSRLLPGREHDLSFFKVFSATSRSKSSCLSSWSPAKTSQCQEQRGTSSSNQQFKLTKRFTRSVPTKLNKMSRLKSIRLFYEEYLNGKTRPPLSFESKVIVVEKSRIIDPTLSDESAAAAATMSLFLDAVHLNQQVDNSGSPSFGILYQY